MNKRYAFSDLHGQLHLLHKIYEVVDDSDTLYCLGDCCDRGVLSYETMIAVLKNNKQIIYLKGNHEAMFVKSAKILMKQKVKISDLIKNNQLNTFLKNEPVVKNYAIDNDGMATLLQWEKAGAPTDVITQLNRLSLFCGYTNKNDDLIFLSHAGVRSLPVTKKNNSITWDTRFLKEDYLLWDRRHIKMSYRPNNLYQYQVHGHTPIQFLAHCEGAPQQPYKYCEGTKIDIDTAAWYSNMTFLLDLDTLDFIRIEG